jgi:hypothetical protein
MLQIVRFGLDQVPAYATFASERASSAPSVRTCGNMDRLDRFRAEVSGAVEALPGERVPRTAVAGQAWLLEDDAT